VFFEMAGWNPDTFVRELGATIGDALLAPHRSYLGEVRPLIERDWVKGLAHITGGGLTENLPRTLPEGCAAEIDLKAWTVPPIFQLLQQHGAIAREEMFRAFNMGVGLVIVCTSRDAERVLNTLMLGGEPNAFRLGILISGRGSNLQAIIDAIAARRLDATIAAVVSNRAGVQGLQRARDAGIDAVHLSPRDYPDRDAYDQALADLLRARGVELVCLAGFMRLVGGPLLDAFPNRILNIHPSLLPAFPGLDAQRQALAHGVRMTGVTVHLVNAELDGGPIVMQAAVPVLEDDTFDTLEARILAEEHRVYPEAIRLFLDGGWSIAGRRLVRAAAS
jgi:formyltetrahydrofolate-dependent phosphoribosylglycinamide formyltransferase